MPGLIALKVGGRSFCCSGPLSVQQCVWVIFPVMLLIPNQLKVNFVLHRKGARNGLLLCNWFCFMAFTGLCSQQSCNATGQTAIARQGHDPGVTQSPKPVRFILWRGLNLVLLILTVNAVLFALYCTGQLPCGSIT